MNRLALAATAFGIALASKSEAAVLAFSGTFNTSNPPAAMGGRCAALTVTIDNTPPFFATGSSNFGNFTGSESHCLNSGPPVAVGAADVPYYSGLFTYSFATGDTLSGTYSGLLSNAGVMGVFDNVQNFLVTGGTGRFANATGSFLGTGQIHFAAGPPTATLTISRGSIDVGAVPEPATWAMVIAGFGATGAALRARRRAVVA